MEQDFSAQKKETDKQKFRLDFRGVIEKNG